MQKIFLASDLHFWHKNVINFCSETRPYDNVEEMHGAIIDEWNMKVGKDDIVYNLGDVSFGNLTQTIEVLSRLNGVHHLIIGNHDQVIQKNFAKLHAERKHDGNRLIESATCYHELNYHGEVVVLCHYPLVTWNRAAYGSFHLHGHTHDQTTCNEGRYRIMNVGMDNTRSAAVHLDSVLSMLSGLPALPREKL